MGYNEHLKALIDAFLSLPERGSQRALSVGAGLAPGWINLFLRTGRASMASGDSVVKYIRRECPVGEEGRLVRQYLAMLDPELHREDAA